MDVESGKFEISKDLEVLSLGENGEIDIRPIPGKHRLSTSKLPNGLPPILPDTKSILNSYLESPEKLPILHLDAVQRLVPLKPDVSSLYSIDLCPLQTTLNVKRDMMTGKLLGFSEEVKEIEGTHTTSSSMTRAPGPPEAGVKGSSNSYPFWPGGMDEPWVDLLKESSLDPSLFEGDLQDTPPGFECGMKFERKSYEQTDYIHSQPQKIYLSEVLAMNDTLDFEMLALDDNEDKQEEINLEDTLASQEPEKPDEDETFQKLESLPVLNISKTEEAKPSANFEWAVVEDVNRPVENFEEKVPHMACEYNFTLDTFQQRAVMHLEKKESVFVAAHTSAGKTVVAEYAIALAKKNLTRVIYTSPIKALSNQKYGDFKEKFQDVGLITGDVQINESAFCLIMTTEILRSMLYHGSDVIRELEWVVFDEVHYINDLERGVVWEEVFIMLPDHVNLIMLSATVPNTAEFAEWLGGIKRRKIYVISTPKRPVPLEHYLYTGSVGKAENNMFLVVNGQGKFMQNEYEKALLSKKDKKEDKNKYKKFNVSVAQEKNIYIGLLGYLKKNDLLPAVCFTFSRKKCNIHAEMLNSIGLTNEKEKGKITTLFHHWISKLKKEDRELPQVKLMGEQLKQGYGVHHSGILPILKEVVEMLFKEGLLKVLFATETFAMGVNMPARTVIFDSIQKFDGLNFRDLRASEYIQMAGRAGRRMLDSKGTVILLCKTFVPESSDLNLMMLGKPTKLESQFKLTYSMILNLLKIKTFRVEDVIKRSFGESDNQKQLKKYNQLLVEAKTNLTNLKKLDCSLCDVDLVKYITALKELSYLKIEVMEKKCSQAAANKLLVPGRILVVSKQNCQNMFGVLISIEKDSNFKFLAVGQKPQDLDQKKGLSSTISPWTKKLFFPKEKVPELMTIAFCDIEVIGNKVLRVDEVALQRECKRFQTMRSNPGPAINSLFQEICCLCETNLNGFPSASITLRDLDFVDKVVRYESLEKSFEQFTCVKCPEFSKHLEEHYTLIKMEDSIKEYNYKLSEESLSLHPEYESRKKVLKDLQYIDDQETVQLKGSVAREMSNHELLITELLVKSVFNTDCPPEEVAALLSCMVFQQRCDDSKLEAPSNLLKKIQEIKEVAREIYNTQLRHSIEDPGFVEQYNFYLVPVVYEWAKGTDFAKIMEETDIDEGIIVRTIQRLCELLKDVRNGAMLVGDTVLAKKMEEASTKIKRDIVFAASLYYDK